MPISPDRILADIDAIAAFSESPPSVGHSRPTFSVAWRQARDYVVAEAARAGCASRVDAFGNVHLRHAALPPDARVWLSGSHLDSVPTGGKYDGVVGVVCPLEVLRAAHAAGRHDLPLELILFAEEEGTTFGLGMIGSRAWTGALAAEHLRQFKNRDGLDYIQAGAPHGVRPEAFDAERIDSSRYRGLIEVHVEQGPAMWEAGVPLAVVTAVAGRRQYRGKFMGTPNHAGSTPMNFRADALAGVASVVTFVESMARDLSPQTVATVGRVECEPNAINVIPGTVRFTVDLRSPDDRLLAVGHERLERMVIEACTARRLAFDFLMTEDQPGVALDRGVCDVLRRAAGGTIPGTVSGALHDAAVLAPILPTAMMFVASKGGISHNPAEFSRAEDIAAAARVLAVAVEEGEVA